jgi:hypothetical protein
MESKLTVPVHLANRTRLDVEMSSRYGLGNGEVGRVRNTNLSASRVERLLSKHLVGELQLGLLVAFACTGRLLFNRIRAGALEDILL